MGRCPAKRMSPPSLAAERGQSGCGSAPRSLSLAGIRRLKGRQLPDAILHGKRSHRPHSRAVQHLSATGFRVGPLSSLGLAVAPPAREPGRDTPVTCDPRLYPLAPGRPPLLAGRWPSATGLASYPSDCIWLTNQRCPCGASPTFWKVSRSLPSPRAFPTAGAGFVHLSVSFAEPPPTGDGGTLRRVLMRSSNHSPSG